MNSLLRRTIPVLINRTISQQLCKRALQSSSILCGNLPNKQVNLIAANPFYNTIRHKSKKVTNQSDITSVNQSDSSTGTVPLSHLAAI